MRLLKLKVRNIASLKGEHTVDFEKIAQGSPLFAITGETGAGKSTLLNCIGLALYGKVYKPNVQQNDVVTTGEKEGQIDLIFEAKGKQYLACWKARVLKANGEPYSTPQSPIRELYNLEGSEFSSEKMITTTRVDEILNLDYDQFCKCVILNQGEFARFLNSSFNDRKDILEKLYPGEVLENLSRELKQQMDSVIQEKNHLEVEWHTLKGDGADGDELKLKSKELKEQLTILESWQSLIETLGFHFTSVRSYHQKNQDYKIKKTETEKEFGTETSSFNTLLKLVEAATLEQRSAQDDLERKGPHLEELLKKESQLEHLLKEAQVSLNSLSQKKAKYQEGLTQYASAEKQLQDLKEKAETIARLFSFPLPILIKASDQLNDLFESWSKKTHLDAEIKSKESLLSELESKGKEIAVGLQAIEAELKTLPADIPDQLQRLEQKKKDIKTEQDRRSRLELYYKDNLDKIQKISHDILVFEKGLKDAETAKQKASEELAPLRTTLKLQEVLSAVKTCLSHGPSRAKGECPVCQTELQDKKWQELLTISAQNDFGAMEERASELERTLLRLSTSIEHLSNQQKEQTLLLNQIQQEQNKAEAELALPLTADLEIEQSISLLQKQSWDLGRLTTERLKTEDELNKTRLSYKNHRIDLQTKTEDASRVLTILQNMEDLGLGSINPEVVEKLKSDQKYLQQYNTITTQVDKISQQLNFLRENQNSLSGEVTTLETTFGKTQTEIKALQDYLTSELGISKAHQTLESIRKAAKDALLQLQKREQDLKVQESKLKEFQSRLYLYDEQIKESEILFEKEMKEVRDHAKSSLPVLKEEFSLLTQKLANLTLSLKDPQELLAPIQDMLTQFKDSLKAEVNAGRSNLAAVSARVEDFEKKLDKMKLLELKLKDLKEKEARFQRLSEVLGKDELRSFVLSLVEENLIRQTNQELQRLCQGRYEIIHQTRGLRLTPEFYILDKFREGGRRKVSTLSGGETFMVSLAMALGLAEMTRGQAEIDSLFIDEGFGTLDQESLEDVLEMLNQIQTRGLMVGVISHIKALTSSVPVNLVLSKKNDGTSTIAMKFN